MRHLCVFLLVATCAFVADAWYAPAGASPPSSVTLLKQFSQTKLWAVAGQGYDDPFYLIDLKGPTRYSMGFAYGKLLGKESVYNYNALLASLLQNDSALIELTEAFCDYEYEHHLSKQLPQEFVDEFQGIHDAGVEENIPLLSRYIERGFTLASVATEDIGFDVIVLLLNEWLARHNNSNHAFPLTEQKMMKTGMSVEDIAKWFVINTPHIGRMHCSMWGAWGSRTYNGTLYTGRNLDWAADTGVNKYKTISVWHPPGKHTYMTIGFAGLTGAITGMSDKGITVHEAGDDNFQETLDGFGWSMRVRWIMENAYDLASAKALWESTNNTMGLNHGIGSAADNQFLAMETKAGYTAYFLANDPREANFNVDGVQYGYPLTEALWRTNHGFDPEFLRTAHNKTPPQNTQTRYMLIHDTLLTYQNETTLIDDWQALNITSVVGAKGGAVTSDFTSCVGKSSGTNIISATFQPGTKKTWIAFENGAGPTHITACCNNYLSIDFTQWFAN